MMYLAPPVVGGRIISRQGCRAARSDRPLSEHDLLLCPPVPGEPRRRWHNGIDIAAPAGTPILAVAPGVIERVEVDGSGYGRHIVVRHGPQLLTVYAHCSQTLPLEAMGRRVAAGEMIASVGATGTTSGRPHLHFEVVRRWPLRSDDVGSRYDVLAFLAALGIVEERGQLVWARPGAWIMVEEHPAPGAAASVSPPGAAAAPLLLAALFAAIIRRRRGPR